MTLYSKWDKGKNITFIASLGMLICLFFVWISMTKESGMSVSDLRSWIKAAQAFGGLDSQTKAVLRALRVNDWRWILLLPMAYPVYSLFARGYNKNIACISSLVTAGVAVLLLILGFKYLNFAAWLFVVFSVVGFIGCCVSKPGAVSAPAAATQPVYAQPVQSADPAQVAAKFCPSCGAKNDADATFCCGCGTKL